MSWAVGYDKEHRRDIGYGVPALCDHPECKEEIDRGLAYVCGSEPYGGETGCGLFFCEAHRTSAEVNHDTYPDLCERCLSNEKPFIPKPDVKEWINHKMTDSSWEKWREENLI